MCVSACITFGQLEAWEGQLTLMGDSFATSDMAAFYYFSKLQGLWHRFCLKLCLSGDSFDIYIKGGLTGATVAFVLSAGRLVVARQRRQFACSQRRSKALREATQVWEQGERDCKISFNVNVFTVQAMEGTCVRAACNGKEAERLYRCMVGPGHGRVRARENQKCTQLSYKYTHTRWWSNLVTSFY